MPAARDLLSGPWRALPVLAVTQLLSWGLLYYPPVLTVPMIAADRRKAGNRGGWAQH